VHGSCHVKRQGAAKDQTIAYPFDFPADEIAVFHRSARHGQLFSRQWLSNRHLKRFSFASRMNAP
jgi:hypothetical protein